MAVYAGESEVAWDESGAYAAPQKKLKNTLPLYGNKDSMNLNSMILTNIMGSPYFKEELILLKTYHEVIDEIFYKVEHLEPWEKNSRKLAGQVGMCAGVRGVAAGGIVSSAYCLLYKMFTLKLTRKQLNAMLNHVDSVYIRGVGFMYIRYCQPPADFWDWFSPYMDDDEEIDLKAGGGYKVTIGEMCRMMVSKLDWFGTLFPRLPVNVQRDLEEKLKQLKIEQRLSEAISANNGQAPSHIPGEDDWGEAARRVREDGSPETRRDQRSRSRDRRRRSRSCSKDRRTRSHSRERRKRSRSRSNDRRRKRSRSHSNERRRNRSRSRERRRSRERGSSRERHRRSRSRDRQKSSGSRSNNRHKSRSRSRERRRRSRSRSKDRDRKSRHSSRSRSKDRRRGSRSRSRDRREKKRSRSRSRSRERNKR